VPHDDGDIDEDEVVLVPPEPFDLFADLVGLAGIVVRNGP
jgi:hypothetical protein